MLVKNKKKYVVQCKLNPAQFITTVDFAIRIYIFWTYTPMQYILTNILIQGVAEKLPV